MNNLTILSMLLTLCLLGGCQSSLSVFNKASKSSQGTTATATATPTPTATVTPTGTATAASASLGINLRFANIDYDEDRMFTDIIKTSRNWMVYSASSGRSDTVAASVDANYWPTQDAWVCVADLTNLQGTYQGSFTGKATIAFAYGDLGTITNQVYTSSSNTTTFTLTYTATNPAPYAFGLAFYNSVNTAHTSGKGISNLQLMRPVTVGSSTSYDPSTVFTDQVKALVAPFATIRFMDYLGTNGNPIQNWSDRALMTDSTQSAFTRLVSNSSSVDTSALPVGGCYEYAIDLCNATGKDMWLNVPFFATDDYVTQLATLVRDRLNSSLHVYVEFSNELWNYQFNQSNDNYKLAATEASTSPALNGNGDTNQYNWATKRTARRIVGISNIFRSVFGDGSVNYSASTSRVRPVLEYQQGSGDTIGLGYIERNFPYPPNYYLYGTGGSAYYYPDDSTSYTESTIWTSSTMDYTKWYPICKDESVIAKAYGLKRIAYEGGPSFDPTTNTTLEAVKTAAWADPTMTTNLETHVNLAWRATDSDLLMFYATVGDVAWGFTQDAFNLNTTKYNAITALNSGTASITEGSVPPFTAYGSQVDGISSDQCNDYIDTTAKTYAITGLAHSGYTIYDDIIYEFRVTSTGKYTVNPNLSVACAVPVPVYCDGVQVGTIAANTTGALTTPIALSTSSTTVTTLAPGLHTVMFKVAGTTTIPAPLIGIKTVAFAVSN